MYTHRWTAALQAVRFALFTALTFLRCDHNNTMICLGHNYHLLHLFFLGPGDGASLSAPHAEYCSECTSIYHGNEGACELTDLRFLQKQKT